MNNFETPKTVNASGHEAKSGVQPGNNMSVNASGHEAYYRRGGGNRRGMRRYHGGWQQHRSKDEELPVKSVAVPVAETAVVSQQPASVQNDAKLAEKAIKDVAKDISLFDTVKQALDTEASTGDQFLFDNASVLNKGRDEMEKLLATRRFYRDNNREWSDVIIPQGVSLEHFVEVADSGELKFETHRPFLDHLVDVVQRVRGNYSRWERTFEISVLILVSCLVFVSAYVHTNDCYCWPLYIGVDEERWGLIRNSTIPIYYTNCIKPYCRESGPNEHNFLCIIAPDLDGHLRVFCFGALFYRLCVWYLSMYLRLFGIMVVMFSFKLFAYWKRSAEDYALETAVSNPYAIPWRAIFARDAREMCIEAHMWKRIVWSLPEVLEEGSTAFMVRKVTAFLVQTPSYQDYTTGELAWVASQVARYGPTSYTAMIQQLAVRARKRRMEANGLTLTVG